MGFLNEHDFTAVSFWIISIAMIAATVFFFAEAATVTDHWKTSLHVGGLVTLVAAVHYMYMREYWVAVGESPIVYRYIDWSITVAMQVRVRPSTPGSASCLAWLAGPSSSSRSLRVSLPRPRRLMVCLRP